MRLRATTIFIVKALILYTVGVFILPVIGTLVGLERQAGSAVIVWVIVFPLIAVLYSWLKHQRSTQGTRGV